MLRNPCTECIFEDNNYYGFSVPFLSLKGFSRKHPKIPDCTCEMSLVLLSYGKNKPCSLVGRARYLKAYMHVISVRRNVAPDDKIAACCHIDIVSRLELPVSHVVLFHVHPLFSLALHGKLRKLQNKSAASKQELAALVAFADAMNPLPWRSDARPMLSCAICLRLFVGKPYAPT